MSWHKKKWIYWQTQEVVQCSLLQFKVYSPIAQPLHKDILEAKQATAQRLEAKSIRRRAMQAQVQEDIAEPVVLVPAVVCQMAHHLLVRMRSILSFQWVPLNENLQ